MMVKKIVSVNGSLSNTVLTNAVKLQLKNYMKAAVVAQARRQVCLTERLRKVRGFALSDQSEACLLV